MGTNVAPQLTKIEMKEIKHVKDHGLTSSAFRNVDGTTTTTTTKEKQ